MMSCKRFDESIEESGLFSSLISSSINKGVMNVKVSCPNRKVEWKGFVIRYNHKIEQDKEAYFLEPTSVSSNKKATTMSLSVDVESFPFRYTHWSIICVYEKSGKLYASRIVRSKPAIGMWDYLTNMNNHVTKDGNIVFFTTTRGSYLGICYRERSPYDSRLVRAKECVARTHFRLNRAKYDQRGIYLMYEKRCKKAQDNGYYLFKYCMDNGMEDYLDREIYYVIEKGSVDRKKVQQYGRHVVNFMSMRHMVYLQAANLILSPDSRAHAYAWQNQDSLFAGRVRNVPHVFLGHGVLALKRLNDSFTAKNMKSVLCTVVSEDEKRVFTEELGYRNTQVAITGYSRFDVLRDQSAGYNEILVMPTHRSWLFGVEREVFVKSDYYRRYMDLINSPHLIEQLEEHDLTLLFYLHPSIGEHIDAFTSSSDRVKIVPYGEYALDDLMMRCKMLITDYSSIAWDVCYMGKPIVFYQYDTQEYMDTWGSYIDLETETPGERVTDFDSLLGAIDSYIQNGFVLKDVYAEKREGYYAFLDNDNSKRICEVLKKRKY